MEIMLMAFVRAEDEMLRRYGGNYYSDLRRTLKRPEMETENRDMENVPLTLAICDYDHIHDLTDGTVTPVGIDLRALVLSYGQKWCFDT